MQLPHRPRVIAHGVTDSTNERAFAALEDGNARHGDVHVATFQTAGRGTHGRRWSAREGENLLMSAVLLPPAPAPSTIALTMAVSLAVSDAVLGIGVPARLKWPNDVLVGSAKLCGILVETRGFDASAPHFVVGVGCNVRQTEFPPEVTAEREVTSLALQGAETSPDALLDALWGGLCRRLAQDAATLSRAYLERLQLPATVAVSVGTTRASGRLIALDAEGGLVLETTAGRETFGLEYVTALEPA